MTYNEWNGFQVGDGWGYTFGLISNTSYSDNSNYTALLNYSNIPLPVGYMQRYGFYNDNYQVVTDTYRNVAGGSFLVKETNVTPIPLPATIALFASGLIGLVLSRGKVLSVILNKSVDKID